MILDLRTLRCAISAVAAVVAKTGRRRVITDRRLVSCCGSSRRFRGGHVVANTLLSDRIDIFPAINSSINARAANGLVLTMRLTVSMEATGSVSTVSGERSIPFSSTNLAAATCRSTVLSVTPSLPASVAM